MNRARRLGLLSQLPGPIASRPFQFDAPSHDQNPFFTINILNTTHKLAGYEILHGIYGLNKPAIGAFLGDESLNKTRLTVLLGYSN